MSKSQQQFEKERRAQMEFMRDQVMEVELQARYWKAQWEAKYYTLEDAKIKEEYDEATKYFRQSIKLNPKLSAAHCNLGVIYNRKGRVKEAIEEFKKGSRQDLVDLTENEIEILLEYLPKQLTEEEVEEIVIETIKEINATSMKDIGNIMKAVMPKVKGRTDGNIVNKVVKKVFS